MIQRKQTLWLLIAGGLLVLTLKFPLYIGTFKGQSETSFPFVNSVGFAINTYLMIIGCIAAIFLFLSRKLQKMVTAAILIYWMLIMYFNYNSITSEFTSGSLTLWSIFYFGIPVFLILAILGIYKDEKLIKSVDRLR